MGWRIDPDNHEGKAFIVIIIMLLILDLFFLVARLFARYKQSGRFDMSDYTLVFALAATIGLVVNMYDTFAHGYGMDKSRFTMGDLNESWKLFPSTEITWNAATTSIRISIMLFYRHLFHPDRRFCRLSLVLVAANLLNFVTIFIVALSICRPMSYIFLRMGNGHCGNAKAYETYTAVSAIIFDGIVVVLPMPLLWNLKMKTANKWGLSILFGLGIVICSLTVIRLIASYIYMADNLPKQNALVDFITGLEPTLGILIACLPFLPQMATWLRRLCGTFRCTMAFKPRSLCPESEMDASECHFNRLRESELLPSGSQATHRTEVSRSDSFTHDLENRVDPEELGSSLTDYKTPLSPTRTGSIFVSQRFVVQADEPQTQYKH